MKPIITVPKDIANHPEVGALAFLLAIKGIEVEFEIIGARPTVPPFPIFEPPTFTIPNSRGVIPDKLKGRYRNR